MLHIPRQLCCLGMCNISLWDWYQKKTTTVFPFYLFILLNFVSWTSASCPLVCHVWPIGCFPSLPINTGPNESVSLETHDTTGTMDTCLPGIDQGHMLCPLILKVLGFLGIWGIWWVHLLQNNRVDMAYGKPIHDKILHFLQIKCIITWNTLQQFFNLSSAFVIILCRISLFIGIHYNKQWMFTLLFSMLNHRWISARKT